MPKLKIKIKLFKVLFKPKNLLVKISNAFHSKKSQETSAASPAKKQRTTMEELLQDKEKSQAQLQHVYYKSISLKDAVETRDPMQEEEEESGKMGKQSKKKYCEDSPGKHKQSSCTTVSSSFSNFIRKKTKISFSNWRTNKIKNGVNVGEEDRVRKKEECNRMSIGRSSYRRSAVGERGLDHDQDIEKREGDKEEEEENEEFELCRRRILMGEKCKPLNVSGKLQYDEGGILLPEEILTKDS